MIDAPTPGFVSPEKLQALAGILAIEGDESLDRAFVFDPLERKGVSFTLALVTKRSGADHLEMVAIGGRADSKGQPDFDFIRRARFPSALLPEILREFIDRCGVEGVNHREIRLDDTTPGPDQEADPVEAVARLLFPRAESE